MMPEAVEKALQKIKVGEKYYVTGTFGGCSDTSRCKKCFNYKKPKYITVVRRRQVDATFGGEINGYRCVYGQSSNGVAHCNFDPRDLVPMCPDWKRKLGGIKCK